MGKKLSQDKQRGLLIWEFIGHSKKVDKTRLRFRKYIQEKTGSREHFSSKNKYRVWQNGIDLKTKQEIDEFLNSCTQNLLGFFWFIDFSMKQKAFKNLILISPRKVAKYPDIQHIPCRLKKGRGGHVSLEISPYALMTEVIQFLKLHSVDIKASQTKLQTKVGLETMPRYKKKIKDERDELIRSLWECPIEDLMLLVTHEPNNPIPLSKRKDILVSAALREVGINITSDNVRKIAGSK